MSNTTQGALALVPVIFKDTTLFLVEYNGEPFVPMKPVVEGMGMSWASQLIKLNSTPRWCVSIIDIPSESGVQETSCLPLRKLPGWLNSIHPNKVDASIRPKVIEYQNECDDVLWRHWSGQHSQLSIPAPSTLKLPYRFEGESKDGITISEIRQIPEDGIFLSNKALAIITARSGEEIARRIADPTFDVRYIPNIIAAAMSRLTALTAPFIPQLA